MTFAEFIYNHQTSAYRTRSFIQDYDPTTPLSSLLRKSSKFIGSLPGTRAYEIASYPLEAFKHTQGFSYSWSRFSRSRDSKSKFVLKAEIMLLRSPYLLGLSPHPFHTLQVTLSRIHPRRGSGLLLHLSTKAAIGTITRERAELWLKIERKRIERLDFAGSVKVSRAVRRWEFYGKREL